MSNNLQNGLSFISQIWNGTGLNHGIPTRGLSKCRGNSAPLRSDPPENALGIAAHGRLRPPPGEVKDGPEHPAARRARKADRDQLPRAFHDPGSIRSDLQAV